MSAPIQRSISPRSFFFFLPCEGVSQPPSLGFPAAFSSTSFLYFFLKILTVGSRFGQAKFRDTMSLKSGHSGAGSSISSGSHVSSERIPT